MTKKIKNEEKENIMELIDDTVCVLEFMIPDSEKVINFDVKKYIAYADRVRLIKEIEQIVFDNSSEFPEIENYLTFNIEFAKRYVTLKYFTNINLPSKLEDLYALTMNSCIYSKIYDARKTYLDTIFSEADKIIEARKDEIIKNSGIYKIAKILLNKLDGFVDKFKNININEILELMSKFQNIDSGNILEEILKNHKDKFDSGVKDKNETND